LKARRAAVLLSLVWGHSASAANWSLRRRLLMESSWSESVLRAAVALPCALVWAVSLLL
jgi:hypothetical protein